jgi:hypothetical protein
MLPSVAWVKFKDDCGCSLAPWSLSRLYPYYQQLLFSQIDAKYNITYTLSYYTRDIRRNRFQEMPISTAY